MLFNYKTELARYRRYYQPIENIAQQPKIHIYTAAIFSFLAISLFGWYAIRPTLQTILFLQKEIADDKIVNQKMEEKITSLIQAQATFQSMQQALPLLYEALPQDPSVVNVLGQLRNLAQTTQASLSAVTIASAPVVPKILEPTKSEKTPPLATKSPLSTTKIGTLVSRKIVDVPTSITLSGPYPSIDAFLNGLISMRRIMTVDSVSIKTDSDATARSNYGENALQLVLKLNVHYVTN